MTSGRMRQYDFVLLGTCAALVLYGLVLIYSASFSQLERPGFHNSNPVARQIVFAVLGAAAMVVTSRIDYRPWGRFIWPLYFSGFLSLIAVFVLGEVSFGARRWISLAGVEVQPSETMKLIVVLTLAKYLSDHHADVRSARVFLLSLGIVIPTMALVLLQPDLGSAIVFGLIWLGMIIIAGASWRHIGVFMATLLLALPFAFIVAITEYQKERISLFFDPETDPLGGGFSIIQAEIGIGSGGLLGKGITHGLQTQHHLVNSQTTDYIFSVVAEELGFIGALVLFALFIVFLFRGIHAATTARDGFGELIAIGIVVMVLSQVFINVAVNVHIVPVTGLPLPFISQGGSSLVTLLIAVGLIQSVRMGRGRGRTQY